MDLFPSDWWTIFAPETALFEHFARGTALYSGVLVLMRIMPRRSGGELAPMDLVFVILIAQAAADAMGEFTSVADGLILVATIMGWNYLINALSYRWPFFEWLVSAPALQIVRDGQMMRRNMRREFVTEEELMSYLHQEGIEDVREVKSAYIEGGGKITVVGRSESSRGKR